MWCKPFRKGLDWKRVARDDELDWGEGRREG